MKNSQIQKRRPAPYAPYERRSGGRRNTTRLTEEWEEAVKKGLEDYDKQQAAKRDRNK